MKIRWTDKHQCPPLPLSWRLRRPNRRRAVCFIINKNYVSDDRLFGAEALIRWSHPELWHDQPDQFISFGRREWFDIFLWVNGLFAGVCRQFKSERESGLSSPIKLSVNLSADNFMQADFLAIWFSAIEETGCGS